MDPMASPLSPPSLFRSTPLQYDTIARADPTFSFSSIIDPMDPHVPHAGNPHPMISITFEDKEGMEENIESHSEPKSDHVAIPPMNDHPTSKSSTAKPSLRGGFLFDKDVALTPEGDTRSSFILPTSESTSRKTLTELTLGSQQLFADNRIFLSRLHFKDALCSFWKGYAVMVFAGSVLQCNCSGTKHNSKNANDSSNLDTDTIPPPSKKSRGENKSSVKVDCGYKIHFTYLDKSSKTTIMITAGHHQHTNHDPSVASDSLAVMAKSHSPFVQFDDNIMLMVANQMNGNKFLGGKDLKLMTSNFVPDGMSMTRQDIWNLGNKVKKSLKTQGMQDQLDVYNEQRLGLQSSNIWKEVNFATEMPSDDVTLIASEVLTKMARLGDIHDFDLGTFLELLGKADTSFTFSILKDSLNRYSGACWMTAVQRKNYELYGKFISIDMCRRELTTQNWSYVSIATLNEFRKVVVCLEGVVADENDETYYFICKCLQKMAPFRGADVSVIAGDGYFSLDKIRSFGFPSANFIADNWHILENLKKNLGLPLYNTLKMYLDKMIYASSKEIFDDAYTVISSKIPSASVDAISYMRDFAGNRSTYSKYLIREYEGSLFLMGSTCSEQNHSSLLSYIRANSKKYKHSLSYFANDLFLRQKDLCDKMRTFMATSILEKPSYLSKIEASDIFTTAQKNDLLKPALIHLNVPSFKMFLNECEESLHYMSTITDNCAFINVKGIGSKKEPRQFPKQPSPDHRCSCVQRKAFCLMCKHEVAAYGKFLGVFVLECHRHRDKIERSTFIQGWRNKYSLLQEQEIGINVDTEDSFEVQNDDQGSIENDTVITNVTRGNIITDTNVTNGIFTQPDKSSAAGYDSDGDSNWKNGTLRIDQSKLTNAQMKSVLDRIYKGWMNNKDEHLKEITFGHASRLAQVLTEVNGLSMLPDSLFSQASQVNENVVSMAGTGKQKRLQSHVEVVQKAAVVKRCGFCHTEGHNVNGCAVKLALGVSMSLIDFCSYIENECPFREKSMSDIIEAHLPECANISVGGVVMKSPMTSLNRMEWENIAVVASCLSAEGVTLQTGLFDGLSVKGFCNKTRRKEIFVKEPSGSMWTVRK